MELVPYQAQQLGQLAQGVDVLALVNAANQISKFLPHNSLPVTGRALKGIAKGAYKATKHFVKGHYYAVKGASGLYKGRKSRARTTRTVKRIMPPKRSYYRGRRSRGRGRKRRRRRGRRSSMRRDIAILKKRTEQSLSTYIKKENSYSTVKSGNGTCDYLLLDINNITLTDAAIDSVKYFDPATPGTLVNVDLSTANVQNIVRVKNVWGRIRLANNYGIPVQMDVYVLRPKVDTAVEPEAAMTDSLAEMSNGSITDKSIYPTDCHDFNDFWAIEKHRRRVVQPGQTMSMSAYIRGYDYDVSFATDHSLEYQKQFGARVFFIRALGTTSHGATSGLGHTDAGVDIFMETTHTIRYPGGANIEYLEVVDATPSVVGARTVSIPANDQAVFTL